YGPAAPDDGEIPDVRKRRKRKMTRRRRSTKRRSCKLFPRPDLKNHLCTYIL
ncbi:Hypothetical protein FKW44_019511, partial [Caligus rogercresseyi]